jgi:hypothetical protein
MGLLLQAKACNPRAVSFIRICYQINKTAKVEVTGGFGIRDVVENVDFDFTAGGMFENTKTFGSTTASIQGYWLAFGFTFRCPQPGQSSCEG